MTTSPSKVAPQHYAYKISPLKAIQEWDLNFTLGNVVKYIARCGKKEGETRLDDLEKAMFYLAKEIEYEKKCWPVYPSPVPPPSAIDIDSDDPGIDRSIFVHVGGGRYMVPIEMVGEFERDDVNMEFSEWKEKWSKYKINP